jgi:DNA repair exonuclease SbcCD ATPase subunit
MPTVLAGLVSTCEHTLADNEARLTNLRSEQGVVDTVQETSQTILSRMAGDTRVREARAKLAGSKARLSSLTAVLGVTPEQLKAQQEEAPNPLRDDLELRLTTARQALITAEQEFTEDAPEVRRAKQMVTLLDEMVGHVTPTREAIVTLGRNPLHDSLLDLLAKATAEVAATDAELATALASLAELDKRLLQLESSRAALQKAEQDVLETKKDLTQAHDGLRLARIESLLDENQVANVTIVAKPGFLPTPMRSFGLPARLALAVGGLLGGLGAGITWVLWRASRRSEARREA